MKFYFYDIESLSNAFTLANFKDDENHIDIFYLVDDNTLITNDFLNDVTQRIYEKNKNFSGTVSLYNLKEPESNALLAKTFGLSSAYYANNPNNKSKYPDEYRLVCDTDTDYDENVHPYLLGYNSYHYDTTMMAMYFYEIIDLSKNVFVPTNALQMRKYNNELFMDMFNGPCKNMEDRLRYDYKTCGIDSDGFGPMDYRNIKAIIRKNMLLSGRHIDVARLNEKQSKVGLKRILGGQGYQILESDKLRPGQDNIENADQFLDLIAYNVSDVVNLKKLFMHKTYQSSFTLKKQLLKTYPELIYSEKKGTYKPEISPTTVRNDRLVIDSSSAQLATKALCPYGHLEDYDTVSFMYPSEAKSKEFGIPRVNVLEESKKFFEKHFTQPEIRARFNEMYEYYKNIEGKNFNSSDNYLIDHGIDPNEEDATAFLPDELKPYKLSALPTPNTCMFYYKKDGTPSSCFVNFSTGGIHGAEYNEDLYNYDMEMYEEAIESWKHDVEIFDEVKKTYPNPCDLKINKGIVLDGVKYNPSVFLKPKATKEEAYYKDYPAPPRKPEVFKITPSGSWNVDKRYTFTSSAMTNHEDFTSYYPNMLRMMDAFFNPGLGYDRYGEIFDDKTKYGVMMKDKSLTADERELYSVMRNGTKLILNSASGAGDANFESNVRMNNKIISMRIIGQLFTWRIGQAQTIEGASIISTNTDGLYSVLEPEHNNEILARESADIHVEIEPEPIFLISKDSNNRAEIKVKKDGSGLGEVESASGGTLGCRRGPNPEKSLAHPAILDWALTEYLIVAATNYKGTSLNEPFNDEIGMSILKSARGEFNDDVQTLTMFQNVIASSPGSQRFIFATTDQNPDFAMPLQHYNRCFIAKDGTPGTYHLKAAVAKAITDATQKKRKKDNERPQQHDATASEILTINGVNVQSLPQNKEATVVKVTGVEDIWYMHVNNSDLHLMPQNEIDDILDNLDYEKYLLLLRDSFENNWRNMTPKWEKYNKEQKTKKKVEEKVDLFDGSIPVTVDNADTTINQQTKSVATQLNDTVSQNDTVNTVASALAMALSSGTSVVIAPTEVTNETVAPATLDFGNVTLPKMIPLNKTAISSQDIYNGEHVLCMNGVREMDAHTVLSKVIATMLNTDIDV